MANKLSEAAAAPVERAASNSVTFDHGGTDAALSHGKRSAPAAAIQVGDRTVPVNKEATR